MEKPKTPTAPPSSLLDEVRVLSLRCFVAVVQTQGFSSAARQLRLSPSAVTKHIRALERAMQVALVHRTTRSITVTQEGEGLYNNCLRILSQLENAAESLVDERRLEGHLRVVAPPAFGSSILAPAMPSFLDKHPRLTIDVFLSSGTPDLIRDRLDVGITIRDEPESKMPHVFLGACGRVLCASPEYLRVRGTPRAIEDLFAHDCIASRFSQRAEAWGLKSGNTYRSVNVRPRLLSDNGEFLRRACLQGAGIGSFYAFHVRQDLEHGALRQVLPKNPQSDQNVFAMLPHREIVRPQAQAFLTFLRGLVSEAACNAPGSSRARRRP